jgi:hypothetical protein
LKTFFVWDQEILCMLESSVATYILKAHFNFSCCTNGYEKCSFSCGDWN